MESIVVGWFLEKVQLLTRRNSSKRTPRPCCHDSSCKTKSFTLECVSSKNHGIAFDLKKKSGFRQFDVRVRVSYHTFIFSSVISVLTWQSRERQSCSSFLQTDQDQVCDGDHRASQCCRNTSTMAAPAPRASSFWFRAKRPDYTPWFSALEDLGIVFSFSCGVWFQLARKDTAFEAHDVFARTTNKLCSGRGDETDVSSQQTGELRHRMFGESLQSGRLRNMFVLIQSTSVANIHHVPWRKIVSSMNYSAS